MPRNGSRLMPRGAFSETNLKLLSIYTLIIFPTRFQQQIKLVQIPVRHTKSLCRCPIRVSAEDFLYSFSMPRSSLSICQHCTYIPTLSRYRQRLFIFIYGSIIVPLIPRFILVLIPILVIFPEVFGIVVVIPDASGIAASIAVIEGLPIITA